MPLRHGVMNKQHWSAICACRYSPQPVPPDRIRFHSMTASAERTEHDLLGARTLPGHAYYGIHTLRALENFPISGAPISVYP